MVIGIGDTVGWLCIDFGEAESNSEDSAYYSTVSRAGTDMVP